MTSAQSVSEPPAFTTAALDVAARLTCCGFDVPSSNWAWALGCASSARAMDASNVERMLSAIVNGVRSHSRVDTCATIPQIPTMPRVLVVEDDPDIADLMRRYLLKAGFEVDVRNAGRDGLHAVTENPPDLLVLDLMLPQVSGLDICRHVRSAEKTATIPIIMVTARAEESERIAGLELGADDYLGKPFSPGELVARVRALLRRTARATTTDNTVAYGPVVLDAAQHTVAVDNQPVSLTAKEFLLLQYLLRNRGRVLSRDVLLTDVWGYTYTGGTRTVDVHVRRLREKLPLLERALVTVKQFGYRLLDTPPDRA